jgi:hypothetical protein
MCALCLFPSRGCMWYGLVCACMCVCIAVYARARTTSAETTSDSSSRATASPYSTTHSLAAPAVHIPFQNSPLRPSLPPSLPPSLTPSANSYQEIHDLGVHIDASGTTAHLGHLQDVNVAGGCARCCGHGSLVYKAQRKTHEEILSQRSSGLDYKKDKHASAVKA